MNDAPLPTTAGAERWAWIDNLVAATVILATVVLTVVIWKLPDDGVAAPARAAAEEEGCRYDPRRHRFVYTQCSWYLRSNDEVREPGARIAAPRPR